MSDFDKLLFTFVRWSGSRTGRELKNEQLELSTTSVENKSTMVSSRSVIAEKNCT